jgi:hypothetical protein
LTKYSTVLPIYKTSHSGELQGGVPASGERASIHSGRQAQKKSPGQLLQFLSTTVSPHRNS